MKHILKVSLAGAIVPLVLSTSVWPKSEVNNIEATELPRPYIVEIVDQNNNHSQLSGRSLSGDIFTVATEIGASPYDKDKMSLFPEMKFGLGGKITLYRTPGYKITDGKKEYEVRSWAGTVGELFAEQKTEIGQDDKVSFAADYELTPGLAITIIRVARTQVFESEAINYKTRKIDDPTLDKGKTTVKQAGKKGEKKLTYEVIREDGVQISKTLKKSEVVKEPVEEILLVGTKPVITVRCKYNDTVLAAAIKYNYDPNKLCNLMIKESNGHADSVSGGGYKGLFQYEEGFWRDASAKAGYANASVFDPTAQIFTTAWAFSHGLGGKW